MRARRPKYVYVAYHKCATRFTERVVRDVCQLHGLRAAAFDQRRPKVGWWALRSMDFLLLTDYSRGMLDLGSLDVRGFHVIRDPRDLLVSVYFSHRYSHSESHEEIARNRAQLAGRDDQEGLRYMMDESAFFNRVVEEFGAWNYERDNFFETTFEKLTGGPERAFRAIFDFLGLEVGERELRAVLDRNSFSNLKDAWAARNPAAEVNHYRRGVSGDWKLHLDGEAKEVFRERYGNLLVKLGYESDDRW